MAAGGIFKHYAGRMRGRSWRGEKKMRRGGRIEHHGDVIHKHKSDKEIGKDGMRDITQTE